MLMSTNSFWVEPAHVPNDKNASPTADRVDIDGGFLIVQHRLIRVELVCSSPYGQAELLLI